jgi:hypothetical protein
MEQLMTILSALAVLALFPAAAAYAQVTPAAGYVPPDDTPSFKVGVVLYADYTWTDEPEIADANGVAVDPSSFNVSRAYINVMGNINHWIAYRITPDITRQTLTNGAQTLSDNNSLVFRLKYAFGQFNMDDAWGSKGSWVRFGEQETPYIAWLEDIYRYRFQGTTPFEREGYLSSSDFGISTHYNFPGNHGDVHAGYYNGENYAAADPNDQKAFEIRATLRPAPMVPWLRGLRLTGFFVDDDFNRGNPRRRFAGTLTYEHKYFTFAVEHLEAREQATDAVAETTSHVSSVWLTPKLGKGWELLLRHDWRNPDETNSDNMRKRNIAGIAYWFKTQAPARASLLIDYEHVDNTDFLPAAPDETRYALHSLFSF